MATTRLFADLDLNFTAHPVTKDIVLRYDDAAIKESIKNLVLTANYERPFHSEIGTPINSLLFENNTPALPLLVQRIITDTINNFEPRAQLLQVDVVSSADDNYLDVTITFTILNTTRPITLTLVLERTR
jgi:phage baseplate assembly protein W